MRASVPSQITAGESLAWTKSFSDYPASQWSLVYSFRGAGTGFDQAAAADGDLFLITVAASQTTNLDAGRYYFQAFVEKDDERALVDSGEVLELPGLAAIDAGESFDGRSPVKKILDAIDALIEGKASQDQLEYTIGDRQLRRYAFEDLLRLRDKYAALYAAECRTARRKKGGGLLKTYPVTFRNPR